MSEVTGTGDQMPAPLRKLADVLDCIARAPRAPSVTLASASLYPSIEALKATIDFLDGFNAFVGDGRGRGLTKPLWDLLIALSDLENGITAPMLRTAKTGTRGASTHYQAVTAWAAIALDTLIADGRDTKIAARSVAALLVNVQVSAGVTRNNVSPDTVINWRENLSRNKGARDAQKAWDSYKKQRTLSNATKDTARLSEWAMGMLQSLVANEIFRISP